MTVEGADQNKYIGIHFDKFTLRFIDQNIDTIYR